MKFTRYFPILIVFFGFLTCSNAGASNSEVYPGNETAGGKAAEQKAAGQKAAEQKAAGQKTVEQGSATILAYHHVSESTPPSTSVSPTQFREHMQYLRDNHTVLALNELVNALQSGETLPDRAVAITFDDGFTNILTYGHPILREFGFPYTIFVNTDTVGTHKKQLSWTQLKTMSEEGALIANHYLDHRHLLQDSQSRDWLEITKKHILQAEEEIKAHIGSSPGYLAYPFGEYNLALAEMVKEIGIVGFAQHSGGVGAHSDMGLITRFPAAGIYANLRTLKVKLASLNMPVLETSVTDPAFYTAPEVNFSLHLDTKDFRPSQLNCFFRGEAATLKWHDDLVQISSDLPLKPGRSRVNCTAPSIRKTGRFYWYSQPFFVATPDGRWLD